MAADTAETIERGAPSASFVAPRLLVYRPGGPVAYEDLHHADSLAADLPRLDLLTVCAILFGGVVAATAALAFVGFQSSDFWTDELFTLFLVDHHGGLGEVLNRALTDTHPPAYYFLLYAWKSAFGLSEASVRSLSALCAVGAVLVFVKACKGAFSRAAITFAAAVGATADFWFFQAQNARNYPFCLLLSASMLAGAVRLRREMAEGRTAWVTASLVAAAGAVAAFSHFYALLTTGFIFGWLILTLPSWRLRGFFVAAGMAILGASVLYIHALSAHTQQNMGELWFTKDVDHLLGVIREVIRSGVASNVQYGLLALLLVVLFVPLARRRITEPASPPDDAIATRRWLLGFGAMVVAGVYLTGVVVSLVFTPSISDQNVLVASPFLWLLWAGLFDRAYGLLTPRARPWICGLLAALLASQIVVQANGRMASRNEQWRDSANYIAALPACDGAQIPVVRPFKFGPETRFFHELTSSSFFGRFLPQNPLIVRSPTAFMTPDADPRFARLLAERANDPSACPVLGWAVHDVDLADVQSMRRAIQRLPGVDPAYVQLRVFSHARRDGVRWQQRPSGFVFVALRPGQAQVASR